MSETIDRLQELKVLRGRVIDFEQDMAKRIEMLSKAQKNILAIAKERTDFVCSRANEDEINNDIFRNHVKLIMRKNEHITLTVTLEKERLEDVENANTLRYLIEATKPLDESSNETLERRQRSLDMLLRTGADAYEAALKQAMRVFEDSAVSAAENIREVERLSMTHQRGDGGASHASSKFRNEIKDFTRGLKNKLKESKTRRDKITQDYLLLRHNSKVIKDLLDKKIDEIKDAQKSLKEQHEKVLAERNQEHQNMVAAAEYEVQICLKNLREKVMAKEVELEQLEIVVKEAKVKSRREKSIAKRGEKYYVDRYNALQAKRKNDYIAIEGELKGLRAAVAEMETKLLRSAYSRGSADDDSKGDADGAGDYEQGGLRENRGNREEEDIGLASSRLTQQLKNKIKQHEQRCHEKRGASTYISRL